MKNKYEEIADSFISWDDLYKKYVTSQDVTEFQWLLDRDGIWKRLELLWLLGHFEDHEEYEKCFVIKGLIDKHFIAEESVQDRLNEMLWINRNTSLG